MPDRAERPWIRGNLPPSEAVVNFSNEVNPHYLDHVVATAATHEVEASEDILAGNGMKLLAKGARIDAAVKDRLLQHKLRKPLEDCVRVNGGITERLGSAADEILAADASLRHACGEAGTSQAGANLKRLKLSPAVQSLLTVYCEHRGDKLHHAVTVCLLSQSLARKLAPGRPELPGVMTLAGLLHDVGELYIDPAFLAKGVRLAPAQWRHIVTHPIVAHRLLKDMAGAGRAVAEAVLQHHERLDGFGYPHRLQGDRLSLDGQILATAELLVGLIESGPRPLARAAIAMKLMPGEFARSLIDVVATACHAEQVAAAPRDTAELLQANLPRVQRIAATLQRFQSGQALLIKQMRGMSEGLQPVIAQGLARLHSIQIAFSSTGMDAESPDQLFAHLSQQPHPDLHLELTTVLREIEWRLRELERESVLRADLVSPRELPQVLQIIALMKGSAPVAGL